MNKQTLVNYSNLAGFLLYVSTVRNLRKHSSG